MRINGEQYYLWQEVDHEGEVLDLFVTKRRHRKAALKFLGKVMKRYGRPEVTGTDLLRTYPTATKRIGIARRHETALSGESGLRRLGGFRNVSRWKIHSDILRRRLRSFAWR
ncbi:MAG: transposase-like protein [Alphaproteobacteria bacterium]